MKVFRAIGMAALAALVSVNFVACNVEGGSNNDGDIDHVDNGGIITSGKQLVKIFGASGGSTDTIAFTYDSEGRVVSVVETYTSEEYEGVSSSEIYQFVWGDDAIRVTESSDYSNSVDRYTYTLANGLIQNDSDGRQFAYNKSGRFLKGTSSSGYITNVLWDGDKLVSVEEDDSVGSLTYNGSACKAGYFPFAASVIDFGCELLFMAHPELAGMRTTQLPNTLTWSHTDSYSGSTEEETTTITYEFDNQGYVTKMVGNNGAYTYELTWK